MIGLRNSGLYVDVASEVFHREPIARTKTVIMAEEWQSLVNVLARNLCSFITKFEPRGYGTFVIVLGEVFNRALNE